VERIKTFFLEVKGELMKVSWPKGKELWGATWVVIIFSIMLAIFIGGIDLLFSRIARILLR
jgi:preprotein translocase subunit SecE